MGYLRATSDAEMGKIGPSPSGCGVNPGWRSGHTSLSSLTVDPPQPSDSASSGPIFVRNPGSPAHELGALGWNATRVKVNNRL
jgi:hypothetical protein